MKAQPTFDIEKDFLIEREQLEASSYELIASFDRSNHSEVCQMTDLAGDLKSEGMDVEILINSDRFHVFQRAPQNQMNSRKKAHQVLIN